VQQVNLKNRDFADSGSIKIYYKPKGAMPIQASTSTGAQYNPEARQLNPALVPLPNGGCDELEYERLRS